MDLKDIRLITFSPTHTSRQVGEAIARGTAIKQLFVTDLTVSAGVPLVVGRQTLTLITVPVYGGHVAPLAMKRLEGIRSEGGPVVLVVVYGNRAFEQALTELQAFATGHGFKVVAGAAFIGEHSYSSSHYPIAAGRPDAADLKEAEDFGWKVADRMSETGEGRAFPVINLEHIPQPLQSPSSMEKFVQGVMEMRKRQTSGGKSAVPIADESLCTRCGYCVEHCPTAAIVRGDECHTLSDRCIRCCACVKGCPQRARSFETPFAPLLSACFAEQKRNCMIIG